MNSKLLIFSMHTLCMIEPLFRIYQVNLCPSAYIRFTIKMKQLCTHGMVKLDIPVILRLQGFGLKIENGK